MALTQTGPPSLCTTQGQNSKTALPRYFFKKNGQLGEVDRRAPRFVTVRAVACAQRLVSEIAR
jgi:hypothetical protein